MVNIEEVKDEENPANEGTISSKYGDIDEITCSKDESINKQMLEAKRDPRAGWITMTKRFREQGNKLVKENDWEGAARQYKYGVENINILLNKDIGDEDDPCVVPKTDEEIKNEGLYSPEVRDIHLLLLKNLALASIKTNQFTMAIEATNEALKIEPNDSKALYRKAYALQCRGYGGDKKEVDEVLKKMEGLELKEGTSEEKEVQQGISKVRQMRSKGAKKAKKFEKSVVSALDSKPGILSCDRTVKKKDWWKLTPAERYKQNGHVLSVDQAFKIVSRLQKGYESDFIQNKIQEEMKKRGGDPDDERFRKKLAEVCMLVQGPICVDYGFEPNQKGLKEMIAGLYDHENAVNAEGEKLGVLLGCSFTAIMSPLWKAQAGYRTYVN